MKKHYITSIVALLYFGIINAQELQKNFINYQGVARNAENELMVGETIVIGIALKVGGRAAAPDYIENHSVSTDANGVLSLKIGNGDPTSGDYNNVAWGNAATFVTVSVNGNEVGTTEMMAVPYALSSGDGAQQADEVPYDNSVSGLPATNAQEALDALAGGGTIDTDNQGLVLTGDVLTIQDGSGSVDLSVFVDDADADINNELQTLDFDPATNALSLSDGNTVIIPSGSTDADADPTNEFQNLSFDAGTNELSLSNGNSVVIPSGGTDADADPTNEFQNLSFDVGTNELSLSDGNSVTIPSGGTDADADPTNEIQTLSFDAASNEINLTDGGTITIPSGGTDADADPTNEIQTLSFDAASNEISLTDGGTITIPSGGTDADADPTNEFQNLSFDSGTNELSLSDGNSVTIPSGGTDADADPTNEIQTLSFDVTSNEISLTDGGTITIPMGGTDADADPTNEFQNLSFDAGNNELSLTNGNSVVIPTGGSDNQNLVLTGDVLTIENGTGTVDLSDYRDTDTTTQSGILQGDGTAVTGLTGTANGQVPKWDAGTNSWAAGSGGTSSGLEAIDEGNGIGWRLKGRDPSEFGTIGENAVDLSYSGFSNSDVGALGNTSIALGSYTTASGIISTAMGNATKASGRYTTAMGLGSEAIGNTATAMGRQTVASGEYATAMGEGTRAYANTSTAIGRFNIGVGNPGTWTEGDYLFEIGNGSSDTNRSNAFSVLKNGNTRIGAGYPQAALDIVGGKWDLNNTNGDFRIGSDSRGLRIGVATGIGPGGGDVRLRAQGGTDRIFLGSGNEDVIAITPGNVAINGDLNIDGELHQPSTGVANMLPVAYGIVRPDGVVISGSGNFTVTVENENGVFDSYRLDIDNTNCFGSCISVISGGARNSGFYSSVDFSSLSGLTFFTKNVNGTSAPSHFQFVVYKP